MRILIPAILVLLSLSAHADDWTTSQKVEEAMALSLIVIDYGQTMDIKSSPGYAEGNRILGDHPTDRKIKEYFAGVVIIQVGAANLLPSKQRQWLIDGTLMVELVAVGKNKSIGLQVKF